MKKKKRKFKSKNGLSAVAKVIALQKRLDSFQRAAGQMLQLAENRNARTTKAAAVWKACAKKHWRAK